MSNGAWICREAEEIAPAIEHLLQELVRRRLGEMEPSPLTTTQQIALAIIVDDGPLRLRALARRIGTTAATATRSTDALEANGLVERRSDPSDGRGVLVCATRKGREVRRESHAQLVIVLGRLLEQLSEADRERFVALMTDLREPRAGVGEPSPTRIAVPPGQSGSGR